MTSSKQTTTARGHTPGRFSFAPAALRDAALWAGYDIDTTPPAPSAFLRRLEGIALDDGAVLQQARSLMSWLAELNLSQAPGAQGDIPVPNGPYVLLLDQPQSEVSTEEMQVILDTARAENVYPTLVILSVDGGSAEALAATNEITQLDGRAALRSVLERATSVYTHSAPQGFDAILAGHKPRVFGQPWYGGWGLTADELPSPYQRAALTRAQLVAAALLHEEAGPAAELDLILADLDAKTRGATEDAHGYVATNILAWKRSFLPKYLGKTACVITNRPGRIAREIAAGRRHIAWGAGGAGAAADIELEDGFLRSRGLGAALVRPVSLVLDDTGLYFDPTRPSKLERLIAARAADETAAKPHIARRGSALISALLEAALSKYNVGGTCAVPTDEPTDQTYVLVAGQVENDASITLGAGAISTNRDLLLAARAAHPDAYLVYKPHPDVEAGLRRGRVDDAGEIADFVAHDADPIALLSKGRVARLWTMTSLIGFEALLRGIPVTCTGAPFYAGWGLTDDIGDVPARRAARPSLGALAHAVLIDYPRYFDPKTGEDISVEAAITLLQQAPSGRSQWGQALLAKIRQFRARFLGLDR